MKITKVTVKRVNGKWIVKLIFCNGCEVEVGFSSLGACAKHVELSLFILMLAED